LNPHEPEQNLATETGQVVDVSFQYMNMKLHFDRPRRNPIYDEYIVTASMLTQFGNSAAKASKK
jgi:hypothetical protein